MKYTAYPAALVAALLLSACASASKPVENASTAQPEPQKQALNIDRTKEVAYSCGSGKTKKPLRVMYGLTGSDVVAAQVEFNGKVTPVLLRDASDTDSNTFKNGPITWNALAANANNVDKVGGNILTVDEKQSVNGVEQNVTQIIVKYCNLDSKATAQLNKAAATKAKSDRTSGEAVNAMP